MSYWTYGTKKQGEKPEGDKDVFSEYCIYVFTKQKTPKARIPIKASFMLWSYWRNWLLSGFGSKKSDPIPRKLMSRHIKCVNVCGPTERFTLLYHCTFLCGAKRRIDKVLISIQTRISWDPTDQWPFPSLGSHECGAQFSWDPTQILAYHSHGY